MIDTYVGGGSGDGSAAINATIDPRGLVAVGSAASPNLYIADYKNHRVRRVDGKSGLIETIAGNGTPGFSGDGGQGQNASLKFPLDVAVDSAGNAYIADSSNNRIRKVTPGGQISTFAGTGQQTYTGEGLANQVAISTPYGVAVGPDGSVYIADFGNSRVRKVGPPGCTPATCVISTVAGTGTQGSGGDGGQATAATLRSPSDIAFDSNGNMFIADWGSDRIRKVSASGVISTVAGGGVIGQGGTIGDGGQATQAVLSYPVQIAVDSAGNLLIADSRHFRIRMVNASTQVITTVAGTGIAGNTGDGGAATQASIYMPWGVVATTPGDVWLSQTVDQATSSHNRVRKVENFETIQSVVGGGLGDGGPAVDAQVNPRGGEAVAGAGPFPNVYFADGSMHVARYVDGATGNIHTIAGTGVSGYSGDGGDARAARLNTPHDVAVDANNGLVYICDTFNNVIRRISRTGVISTVAGNGSWGFNGDGPATQRSLAAPLGIDLDAAGNLYIADADNNRVRMVSGDTMTTVAGSGTWGYGGDGLAPTASGVKLRTPWDVAVSPDGSVLYISDSQNDRIRRVANGTITTFAGNGIGGFSGDLGLAILSKINVPTSLALDGGSNLYFADSQNNRVRRVDAIGLTIQTVAGNGQYGPSGDGGSATAASFSEPSGVMIAADGGMLFISTKDDARMRLVTFDGAAPPTPTASFTATATPAPATPTQPPPNATSTRTGTATRTPTITATGTRTGTATRTPTDSGSGAVLGGVKYYANQQAVPGVQVGFTGPTSFTAQTNSAGNFAANDIALGTWGVQPNRTGGFGTAVSSLDAARVLQAIAGLQHFNGLQSLACDVTGDGTLSAIDAVRILQFSAGVLDRLPVADLCGSDWLFYPSPDPAQNQQVINPSIGSGRCLQGSIVLNPLVDSASNQDFDAILFGDCTGNWTTANGGALRQLASRRAVVHAGVPRQVRGGRIQVPIYVQAYAAFQALDVVLSYAPDHLTYAGARPRGAAAEALVSASSQPGVLRLSLASGTPIQASAGAILMVEFASNSPDDGIDLEAAQVDETTARVVTHGTAR
ncbi:MAG: hypothetical protein ACRERC_22105 [Candidatus Binatia bacterium]